MTDQEKTSLMQYISNGNIRAAIDKLLTIKRNKTLNKEALAIASRYHRLKRQERLGVLTSEQLSVRENRIVEHLINVINHPEDIGYRSKKSIVNRHIKQKYIIITTAVVAILISFAEAANIINVIPSNDPLQLSIFVKDMQNHFVLQGEGRINIALGNRSFIKLIDEHGTVSFPDIPSSHKGNRITIGLEAEGWEIDGQNTFIFNGKPIIIKVKRDHSLGVIKGVIKSRDGQEFISGVEVRINTDTSTFTNANGIFSIVLPEKMRIKKETEAYLLTIRKVGYKTRTQLHYPKSSNADIRLEKE